MNPSAMPAEVVQAQLDAYNAKDLSAWLQTYAADAEQFSLHGQRLAKGRDEIGARIAVRFTEPDLHAALISRVVVGNFVVDHELITRNLAEGKGTVAMLCVYEVVDGLIARASFALGEQKPDSASQGGG